MPPSPRAKPRSTKITAKTGKSITPKAGGSKIVYANREMSWLAFNRRVLDQAKNEANPLLERTKFLAIVSSNLDEFFEIRIAGLLQQKDSTGGEPSIDGLSPREQLKRAFSEIRKLVDEQYACWNDLLVPALAREKITFKTASQLTAAERAWVQDYFVKQVHPVLTPLAIDQSHPFPQIANKTLNVIVTVDNPDTPEVEGLTAVLPVPRILPRLVQITPDKRGPQTFVFLSEIIKLCAGELFPGYRVISAQAFRVTRNSDLYIDDEEAENLLKKIEEELRNLRRGAAVRLEIEADAPAAVFQLLCEHLQLDEDRVFKLGGPLNLVRMMSLSDLVDRPDLKFAPFAPCELPALKSAPSIYAAIHEGDILLHHPYDSFNPVVEFVKQGATDPAVLAIKQTLYRTSGDSPIIGALIEASRNGKQVTALIELKARFDEANNIKWAKELEEAGVHVVFGLVGHKTHCKCSMIVRQEADGIRRYVHLGTGNYNPKTARLYTDLSLLTCNPEITAEVAQLFNTLTGFGRTPEFKHLIVAPFNLHSRIQELIANEATNAAAGKPARIIAKMNKLVDKVTIDNLYAASQAGVQIDLIVRATCCLVPGVKGLSENIRIRNLVGRYLEHPRIYYFENDTAPLLFAGSSDWMTRNFFRRVEALFPIYRPDLRDRVLQEILPSEFKDNVDACELQPDGTYLPPVRKEGEAPFSAQKHFMALAAQRATAPLEVAP
ncbi:Polyphosphate kinase [Lacunisphaera limnophila]|uniref:Polyphosphate kinase n=1 Tax=Lacunisphaera limnophila TaxID=1838286 RepID=A0A1D8AYV2_9BACT|nr:polyphosphate kinase 1 [Lacunisphaera limnophila]AOS46057.1 Polyphosphate kinase [Lacunisphaera limnophila]